MTKRLQYLNGPSDTYRIDLHKPLLLDKAGLTWDGYRQEIDDQREQVLRAARRLSDELGGQAQAQGSTRYSRHRAARNCPCQ
ncbi:MAG: hypothetical protein MZV65_48825 [Chromatiales bacterium]|nr:hypothetical protein [Chromatiales bacterium]